MLKISSLFEAYITNLGKYNEGRLVGETLKFPATTEEVQALLKRIGVDGVRYEEIFITSFDGDVLGLYDHLGEYESIDELNHLAHVLSDLDQSDIEKFEAVIDSGEYTGSVHDLINLAQNLDCYDFYPGIDSEEALGRAYIEEMEMLDVPDNVLPYFDFEAYGRDARINDGGHFAPGGYVFNNGGSFVERYHGMEDIPPEHRIFAYPKLNIREQMAAYQEVIDRSALNEEKLRLPDSREERYPDEYRQPEPGNQSCQQSDEVHPAAYPKPQRLDYRAGRKTERAACTKGGGGSNTSSQSADEVYGDTKGRTEGLDKGWTEPGDFTGLKGSQRSPVLSPSKGAFYCGGLRSISGIFREISRRLPQSDEAKGSPQQSD